MASSRCGPGEASTAAADTAPATMTQPMVFFSYQTPRHSPALTSWWMPMEGRATTKIRLSTARISAVWVSSTGSRRPGQAAAR